MSQLVMTGWVFLSFSLAFIVEAGVRRGVGGAYCLWLKSASPTVSGLEKNTGTRMIFFCVCIV